MGKKKNTHITKQTNVKRISPLDELGRTGLDFSGGMIFEEFLPELTGIWRVKVFKEMSENDPVVGAILFAIDMLMRNVEWRVQPASEDQADLEAAEFVEGALDDMSTPFADIVSEILSMLVFGHSVHEIVYKRRLGDSRNPTSRSRFNDGRIGWRKLPIRAQETIEEWLFDDEGGLQGVKQLAPPDYKLTDIPIEKLLLFRTETKKANPEGRSILRNAFRPWFFKKHIEEIEGIGIERDLAGLPIAFVPPEILDSSATAEQKAILTAVKNIVVNVRRDEQEGIVFPLVFDENNNQLYRFELLSTGGKRNFDTSDIIQRYDQRIAITSLADFILLGHEKVGSFALASNKTHLFAVALGAWLQNIAAVFNRFAIPRLFALNEFNLDELPELVPGDIESQDLAELGEFIAKISGAGASLFPDEELENFLRRQANLPERQDGSL